MYYDFNAEVGDSIVIAVPGMHYEIDGKIIKTEISYKTDHKKNWLECTYAISDSLSEKYSRIIEYY